MSISKLILALEFPGFSPGNNRIDYGANPGTFDLNRIGLGELVSMFLNIGFFIAGFLLLAWFGWGVFQYIFAGGNKENLAKARARIQWAIIGFLIVVISFAVSQYVQKIIPFRENQKLTPVTNPGTNTNQPGTNVALPTPPGRQTGPLP